MALFDQILSSLGFGGQPQGFAPQPTQVAAPRGGIIMNPTNVPTASNPAFENIIQQVKQRTAETAFAEPQQQGFLNRLGEFSDAILATSPDPDVANFHRAKIEQRRQEALLNQQRQQDALRYLAEMQMKQQQIEDERKFRESQTGIAQEQLNLERQKLMQPSADTKLGKLMLERDRIMAQNPNDPRISVYDQAIKTEAQSSGGTTVNVNTSTKKADEKIGEFEGGLFAEIQQNAIQQTKMAQSYETLQSLLQDVETGKFKGTTNEIKKAAKSAGVDLEALNIRDDVAPVELARKITDVTGLAFRQPGMGNMTDREFAVFQSIPPGVETTPEGRKLQVDIQKKIAAREREIAKLARQYRKDNGTFDAGFMDLQQAYVDANPLFDDNLLKRINDLSSNAQPARQTTRRIRFDAQGNIVQ